MMLVDLDPGTTYQVRVVAKNGHGYEAAASWLTFHTPGVGQSLNYTSRVIFMKHINNIIIVRLLLHHTQHQHFYLDVLVSAGDLCWFLVVCEVIVLLSTLSMMVSLKSVQF